MKNICNTIKTNIKQTVINNVWLLCHALAKKKRVLIAASVVIITMALSTGPADNAIASSDKATTTVGLNVNSTITLTGATGTINMTGPLNTTLTAVQTLSVTTNGGGGYILQMEMNNSSTSLFNVLDSSKTCTGVYKCVPTTNNGLASSNGAMSGLIPANAKTLQGDTWGYNFSGATDAPAGTFFTVPAKNNPQVINGANQPVSNHPTYVTYGAYPTSSFPSGNYQNGVLFTATSIDLAAPPTYAKVVDGANFQDVTTNANESCQKLATFTGSNMGAIITMTDSRNGQQYRVAKLPDNKCWMVDNLRLKLADGMVLTAADTDVAADTVVHFTVDGTSAGAALSDLNADGFTTDNELTRDGTSNPEMPNYDAWRQANPNYTYNCKDNVGKNDYGYDSPDRKAYSTISLAKCGYLYNYYTATAATAPQSAFAPGNASGSICPKGWRLPTGWTGVSNLNNDFPLLNAKMLDASATIGSVDPDTYSYWSPTGVWLGALSGSFSTIFDGQGYFGGYWSSTMSSEYSAAALFFVPSNGVNPGDLDGSRNRGYALRCVLRS
jgi:uncharacterized protein (TIGR02145 family)